MEIESTNANQVISPLFNLVFASNAILSCFFFSLLIIELYFSITAVFAKTFIPTEKLAIPTGIPTKEAKVEMGTHSTAVK